MEGWKEIGFMEDVQIYWYIGMAWHGCSAGETKAQKHGSWGCGQAHTLFGCISSSSQKVSSMDWLKDGGIQRMEGWRQRLGRFRLGCTLDAGLCIMSLYGVEVG